MDSASVARGSTPLAIIEVCQRLVVQAGVAMRAVPRVFAILYRKLEATTVIPAASSVRWWLQRLGLYALREPLPKAGDWVLLIDHSVQIGTVKVCVILGIRLCDVPFPQRALRFEDMQVIAVIPVEQSTGEIVDAQLEQATLRIGIPRQIVSDGGSDVKKGAALFAGRHPETTVTYDAAHHGAIVLKRRFEDDPQWSEYIGRLGQIKSCIRQTSDAFLASPSLRPKARYMNLESLLKWSRRILDLLDRGASGGRASKRAELRYGWLRDYLASIEKWSRWEATVRASVSYVRTRGLSVGSEPGLRQHLSELPSELYDETLATELESFVRESSAAAGPDECLVGSTEVLESLFGKWKTLERQESQSGITGLVLSLGALLGAWPPSRIQAALEATPVKHVVRWCHDNLPTSVQSQRRITLSGQKV
ncbi:MAG: hypothetical protein QGG09_11090 [Pirellulaceae bacterium]|nr:hypothetical protein [Pirellulaceae bacterium]HJN13496.1 hypothetical protein [Pirellulaceae bacterium]